MKKCNFLRKNVDFSKYFGTFGAEIWIFVPYFMDQVWKKEIGNKCIFMTTKKLQGVEIDECYSLGWDGFT